MNRSDAGRSVLLAAERLYYARGIHAVGMDEVKAEAGVSLKRLYQLYPAKEQLVDAYLRRRDGRWRVHQRGNGGGCGDPRAVRRDLHLACY